MKLIPMDLLLIIGDNNNSSKQEVSTFQILVIPNESTQFFTTKMSAHPIIFIIQKNIRNIKKHKKIKHFLNLKRSQSNPSSG